MQKHIGWDLVAGVRSEAVLEVVEVEAEVDQPPDGLPRQATEGFCSFKLTSRSKDSLKHRDDVMNEEEVRRHEVQSSLLSVSL